MTGRGESEMDEDRNIDERVDTKASDAAFEQDEQRKILRLGYYAFSVHSGGRLVF